MTWDEIVICEKCGGTSDRGDVCSGCDVPRETALTRAEQYRLAVARHAERTVFRQLTGMAELHRLANMGRGGHREWSERW